MGKGKTINSKVSAIIIVVVIMLTGGLGYLYINSLSTQQSSTTQVTKTNTQEESNGAVTYQGEQGETALELLKSNYDVETKEFDFGEMVTEIEGVKSDKSNFWAFYVNGKLSQEGAGDYKTKVGDKIEWRLDDIK